MMRKIMPCSGCGKTSMCVSHDSMKFYCNRCLPYYVRQNFYWAPPSQEAPQVETPAPTKTVNTVEPTTKKKGPV